MEATAELPPQKRYLLGTHRIRPPEETWTWISRLFSRVGITRVADVTGLDVVGIPVYQAVRPAAKSLAVSQGKAPTRAAARVSAAMESIELWHAENVAAASGAVVQVELTLREVAYANPFPLDHLPWRADSLRFDAVRLPFLRAESLLGNGPAWLPRQIVDLAFPLPRRFEPRMFHRTSNGLASGNCRDEALVHALCEVIERHALYLVHRDPGAAVPLASEAIDDPPSRDLLDRFRRAGMKVALYDVTWGVGVPAVVADVAYGDLPNVWRGAGCHLAPEVALSRALTEAAQSRLTYIAGSRDDLRQLGGPDRFARLEPPAGSRALAEVGPLRPSADLAADRERILGALAAGGYEPFAVDLTREDLGVPVVKVFCPGLGEAPYG